MNYLPIIDDDDVYYGMVWYGMVWYHTSVGTFFQKCMVTRMQSYKLFGFFALLVWAYHSWKNLHTHCCTYYGTIQ